MTAVKFPAGIDNSGGTAFTLSDSIEVGPGFNVSAEQVIHGWFIDNVPDAVPDCTVSLYKDAATGSPIARVTDVDLVSGDNSGSFVSPVTLDDNATYYIQIYMPTLSYRVTSVPLGPPPFTEGVFSIGLAGDADGNPSSFYEWAPTGPATPPVIRSGFSGENTVWHGIGVWYDDEAEPPEDVPISVSTVSPRNVVVGSPASLNATVSNATGSVDYAWAQTSGSPAQTITNPTSAVASVTPGAPGTYVFTVTVEDDNSSDTATVTVVATAVPEEPEDPEMTPITSGYININGVTYGPFSPNDVPGDEPHVYRPESFGAVGDNVTDDTEAFKLCVAAAVAGAPSHNNYAEVRLAAKTYLIASPSDPGHEHGNAQIPIPFVSGSLDEKITLVFKGVGDNSPFIYWAQTTPHKSGSMLRTSWNPGGETGGLYGTPAVLGGPSYVDEVIPQDPLKTMSNMVLVLDGILVQIPRNYYIGAFNASRMAQLVVKSAGVISDRTYGSDPAMSELPTHDYMYGLYAPVTGNNARTQIDCFTAEGVSVALYAAEHVAANYLGFVYCRKGLILTATGNDNKWEDDTQNSRAHSASILRLLCEGVQDWVINDGYDGQLRIVSFDGEGGEGVGSGNFSHHIVDPESKFVGEVHFGEIFSQSPVVVGAEKLRVISDQQVRGNRTAPALPATDVALKNPFWRDASVYISGGTVTAIEIGGENVGVTSGLVFVPTGMDIKLTYSGTPTWKWVLS